MPYIAEHDKEYRAVMRFGVRTDTQDMSGRVLSETAVPSLTLDAVVSAARAFVGRIRQTPPMYSALHHEGRRLYELARQGVEVERPAREVTVYSIDVEEMRGDGATLRVVCGKGTYVRTLVADLGDALGVGAAVERLSRIRVGPFRLADAVTWAALTRMSAAELEAHIGPPASALGAFRHGQTVEGAPSTTGFARVHDTQGTLIGVGAVDSAGRLRPVRILHADRSDARVLPA